MRRKMSIRKRLVERSTGESSRKRSSRGSNSIWSCRKRRRRKVGAEESIAGKAGDASEEERKIG